MQGQDCTETQGVGWLVGGGSDTLTARSHIFWGWHLGQGFLSAALEGGDMVG